MSKITQEPNEEDSDIMAEEIRPRTTGVGPYQRATVETSTAKSLHILIPDVVTDDQPVRSQDERATHNSEKEDYILELETLSRSLGFTPTIHRMTIENHETEISKISASKPTEMILNLCDGSDIDGVPGPCVAKFLEENKYPRIIGCDSLFILNTTTKSGMKRIFMENLVSCPLGFLVTSENFTELGKLVEEWGMAYPLFAKISDSYGSIGLDESSVCHDFEQLKMKVSELLAKFENVIVEEYIDGPEFSVLISGNCRDPDHPVVVYPPAERAFSKDVPQFKRFITFLTNWDESLQTHQYAPVHDPTDFAALQDIARRAYISVSGNCYGRVDIRKRDISGKFYVLEVNASCGLGKGSSSDFILRLAGQTMQDFFRILLQSGATEPDPRTAKLLRNPSLSVFPTPIIHIVVSAVLDPHTGVVPEFKLDPCSSFFGTVVYVSDMESLFRNLGYDPIVHLYNFDDEDALKSLDRVNSVVVNACTGTTGIAVAKTLRELKFGKVVGLDPKFVQNVEMEAQMKRNNIRLVRSKKAEIENDENDDVVAADAAAVNAVNAGESNEKKFFVLVCGDSSSIKSGMVVCPAVELDEVHHSNAMEFMRRLSMQIQSGFQKEVVMGLKPVEKTILQLELQDLARRAYTATEGQFCGLVKIVNGKDGLKVDNILSDVDFGEGSIAQRIFKVVGMTAEDIFGWWLKWV